MPVIRTKPRPPMEWVSFFTKADVLVEELDDCKANRAKAVKIGQFFTRNLGREISIDVRGRTGKAVLRVEQKRAKEKRYYFEVTWDDPVTSSAPSVPPDTSVGEAEDHATGRSHRLKKPARATKRRRVKATAPDPPRDEDSRERPSKDRRNGNDESW